MQFIYCRLCCTARFKALTCHIIPYGFHHRHSTVDSLACVQGAHLHRAIRCPERKNTGEHSAGAPGWPRFWSWMTGARIVKQIFALPSVSRSRRICLCATWRRRTSAARPPGRGWRRVSARRSSWTPTQWGVRLCQCNCYVNSVIYMDISQKVGKCVFFFVVPCCSSASWEWILYRWNYSPL